MSQISISVLSLAQSLPEGGLLSPKELLHLGSRAAVDQTLTRLAREGQLIRLGRGLYALPVQGRFGVRPPSTESVVRAIEASKGETIVASGASEANMLGLTTQVPVREVMLTSGPSRKLQLGQQSVELQHAKSWMMALGKRPAGKAIRALAWLGPEHSASAVALLRTRLPAQEWAAMRSARAMLPSWMALALSQSSQGIQND